MILPLQDSVNKLNILISQFRFDEALREFYDESVVCYENENLSAKNLSAHREAGKKYLASTTNRSATLTKVLISGNFSVCEWHYIFDHSEWGHWECVQLSVQRWKNGKIIHERHHYEL
jgi:hypothetical protein